MISCQILEDGVVIVVTFTGQVTVEDFETAAPKFYADAKSQAIRRALLDARKYQGLASKRAESLSFTSSLLTRSVFDRIAVVFHEAIREEMLEFSDLVRNAGKEMRLFPQNQYEAALDWLKSDLATDKQE